MTAVVGPGEALCDGYDAALFDLDGVIYLGPQAVPGAAEAVDGLRTRAVRVAFVTNNAARPPQVVVDQLNRIGVHCVIDDVVTSAQAAARMLGETLAPGARVLCLGTTALAHEVESAGFTIVASRADAPDAVIQGYDPDMTWPRITDGVHAIQAGAAWFVCNLDLTRPTDLGLEPGVGTQVNAVASCFPGMEPPVAGKPYPGLLRETLRRLGTRRPIFVGDRIDTDIMGAFNVDMDSLFVFTGAHGIADLVTAGPAGRPTHLGYDVSALLEPPRRVVLEGQVARCAQQRVRLLDGVLQFDDIPGDRGEQLDALWAALQLLWRLADSGELTRESWAPLEELVKLH